MRRRATAAARHAIRVLAALERRSGRCAARANDIMLAEEFGGRFVTASAAHLSWLDDKLHVVLATAGASGPVLVKPDGSVQVLPGGGVPLGIFPDPEPASLELELADGDVLFFFTDGLADARSPACHLISRTVSGDCLCSDAPAWLRRRSTARLTCAQQSCSTSATVCSSSGSDHARAQGRRLARLRSQG